MLCGLVVAALMSVSCGVVEVTDETAYSEGEKMAEAFLDTSSGSSHDKLAELCEAARDKLGDSGEFSESELFSYVLGCKDRLREEFGEERLGP